MPLNAFQSSTTQCATITSIEPTSGPSTGNTEIRVLGAGFIHSDRLQCKFGDFVSPAKFVSPTEMSCVTPATPLESGSAAFDFSVVMIRKPISHKRAIGDISEAYILFASGSQPISFTYNYVAPSKKSSLAWIAAPVIIIVLILVIAVIALLYARRRYAQRKLTPPDFNQYAFSANAKLMREVPDDQKPLLDEIVHLLYENSYALPLMLAKVARGSDDDLLSRALIYVAYSNSFALDMLVKFIEIEVENSMMEGELFRASSIACKMYTIYSKVLGVQYLWKTLARSIHALDEAGQAEDRRDSGSGPISAPPSSGHVSMIDLGSLEVDPERLADKLEKEVDEAVLADVAIYQYELLLKTSRIFKKVMDSVENVPRELRVVGKHVKELVAAKYPEREMDYKGVCAFFFLRFICPAVMTPQIYGVLEAQPGETSQRYFVLISKTLQNLANGTLPSQKEAYMAKMDEFVIDNKETLFKFIDKLCDIHEAEGSQVLDSAVHTADSRLKVSDELYYSSLLFIHTHYHANSGSIQEHFRQIDEEFGQRIHAVMNTITPEEKKPKKKKKKKSAQASASNG